jgi:hypothetical protein
MCACAEGDSIEASVGGSACITWDFLCFRLFHANTGSPKAAQQEVAQPTYDFRNEAFESITTDRLLSLSPMRSRKASIRGEPPNFLTRFFLAYVRIIGIL